jgi:hypothetical protein
VIYWCVNAAEKAQSYGYLRAIAGDVKVPNSNTKLTNRLIQFGKWLTVAFVVIEFVQIAFNVLIYPQPSLERISILKATSRPNSPIIPLASQLDSWGRFQTIDFDGVNAFNPSLLTLPYAGKRLNGTFVVVAREEYKWKWMDGIYVQPRHVVAGLLHVSSDPQPRRAPQSSDIIQSHSIERMHLVHSNATYFPKCEQDRDGLTSSIQGPEDPRLIWTHLGEPLMIYNSVSPEDSDLCRHLYLIDLRSVSPVVREIISESVDPAPIRFPESLPISFRGQEGIHKNWAIFSNKAGEVFVHVHLIPQTIYKISDTMEQVVSHPAQDENCISIALKDIHRYRVHQSTPFLDVVLCRSNDGSCDADDPNNHVYMGVIHGQHKISDNSAMRYYETRVVTLNYSLPFNYISISKPLLYCMALWIC